MYEPHPHFESAPDDTPIWRYMDFTKLVSLLNDRALFSSRADLLGDRFEGSYTRPTSEQWADESVLEFEVNGIHYHRQSMAETRKGLTSRIFANRWHMNEYESTAMWSVYCPHGAGIAVRSTFARLRDSLTACKRYPIFIGKVKYIDYERASMEGINTLTPFLHKRMSYAHERELRAVIWYDTDNDFLERIRATPPPQLQPVLPPPPPGLTIPVDLDTLIDQIRVAPTTPGWLHRLVEAVLAKYGVVKEVCQSSLDADPLY